MVPLSCSFYEATKMSANQEVTSSGPCGAAHAKRSVDKLNVKEFRERFCVPNGVSVELTDSCPIGVSADSCPAGAP